MDERRKKLSSFIVLTVLIFSLYVYIPVKFIPGNTLAFYIPIEPWWGFLLLAILAAEVSFIITNRVFLALQKKRKTSRKNILTDVSAVGASILPSIFACPILAVTILSFLLPVATIWTLVGLQWHIVGTATVLMAALIFYKIRYGNVCIKDIFTKHGGRT